MPDSTVATRPGARVAADRIALVRHGRRTALARRSGFGQLAEFGLHLQRDIAGNLAERAD
jgi:hypothetical protein